MKDIAEKFSAQIIISFLSLTFVCRTYVMYGKFKYVENLSVYGIGSGEGRCQVIPSEIWSLVIATAIFLSIYAIEIRPCSGS